MNITVVTPAALSSAWLICSAAVLLLFRPRAKKKKRLVLFSLHQAGVVLNLHVKNRKKLVCQKVKSA